MAKNKSAQTQQMNLQQSLSPKQLLLMRLLEVPSMELEQMVKEELEKNPLLEVDSRESSEEPLSDQSSAEGETRNEGLEFLDDETFGEFHDPSDDNPFLGGISETSLTQYLEQQLDMLTLTPRERLLAEELLGNLDDAGYLSRSLLLIENDLAFQQDIDVTQQELESVLDKLQSLDPAGVGARTLQECLLLQLDRFEHPSYEVRYAKAVVQECFDLFARRQYELIAEQLEIDLDSVQAAANLIHRLNPKPCATKSASAADTQFVSPDFIVSYSDGHLSCTLADTLDLEPRVSRYYESMLQSLSAKKQPTPAEKETIDYLKSKQESAQDFVDNLRQRGQTLQKTMSVILRRQRQYFITGDPASLKPLTQHEVALAVGMDDSTISRVVNSKYVQTDFGLLPLKHFFSLASISADGQELSTEAVKHQLQQIIDTEDKSHPFTDDQLASLMEKKGCPMARRTVAKYRQMLNIPVASLRRVLKLLPLLLLLFPFLLGAQTPMSYYDSLIYLQQHPTTPKATPHKSSEQKTAKRKPLTKPDSTLFQSDDLIDHLYNASLRPSIMWYGTQFSAHRVKPENFHIDSLPDAVSLRLIQADSDFCFPVKNIITSPYGWRWERAHRGVDIRLNTGDPVRAAFAGVVRIACPMGAYGNLVVIRHNNGLETVYGHLSKINVRREQVVRAGETIGLGGSTGRSTGPHLHFEVRFQYEPFDPEWILDFSNYTLRTRNLHLDKTYFGISRPTQGLALSYKADKSFVKEAPARQRSAPREIYYVVISGDTLESIAQYYRTTPEAIQELNPNMKKLKKGLRIRVR